MLEQHFTLSFDDDAAQELSIEFGDQKDRKSKTPVEALGFFIGGGTNDYSKLTNKPKLNGRYLQGNKSFADYGLAALTSDDLHLIHDEQIEDISKTKYLNVDGVKEILKTLKALGRDLSDIHVITSYNELQDKPVVDDSVINTSSNAVSGAGVSKFWEAAIKEIIGNPELFAFKGGASVSDNLAIAHEEIVELQELVKTLNNGGLKVAVVDELPSVGATDTLYYAKKVVANKDVYNQFIWNGEQKKYIELNEDIELPSFEDYIQWGAVSTTTEQDMTELFGQMGW